MEDLSLDEYQDGATRTLDAEQLTKDSLLMTALGLCGESGEVAEHVKKHIYHGHNLDREKVAEELGDVLWYIAALADTVGVSLEYLARKNLAKLQERYPDGFSEERSRSRSVSKDD